MFKSKPPRSYGVATNNAYCYNLWLKNAMITTFISSEYDWNYRKTETERGGQTDKLSYNEDFTLSDCQTNVHIYIALDQRTK